MMNNTLNAKGTFAFVGFLGEQVTSCGLSESDLSAAGDLKSFLALEWVLTFGMTLILNLPLLVPSNRRRTYGTLWE